jgi:uncharacterized protein
VIGSFDAFSLLAIALAVPALAGLIGLVYLTIKYTPVIGRNFEKQPLFMPLRVKPIEHGESVEFAAVDGLRLSGSYFRKRTEDLAGVMVYCHEYLSNRWSFHPYIDQLRDLGYDIFTFDFRNHGSSEHESDYSPLQWTSDREILDLRGALAYLRTRPDHDPAGVGLFGVSRGGTTALVTAAIEPSVWGVITDGAFPTRGTLVRYIVRWAEIYVNNRTILRMLPQWVYPLLGWFARRLSERRLGCRFPDAELSVARLAPRPWLMIHGGRDTYIGPEIARELFSKGNGPKELWLVPDAKHNRCRDSDEEAYAARLEDFLERFAPRRPFTAVPVRAPRTVSPHAQLSTEFGAELSPAELRSEVVTPITG